MTLQSTKYSEEIEIRPMRKGDIKDVLNIQKESGLSFWSFLDYEKEISNKDSICKVAEFANKKVVGFVVVHLLFGDMENQYGSAEIYNIAIKEKFRKKGIGQKLLNETIGDLKNQKISEVWLEVRKSNENAIKFYRKNGFTKKSERKNYYQNPREDALILLLKL